MNLRTYRELVEDVHSIYRALPPQDKQHIHIYAEEKSGATIPTVDNTLPTYHTAAYNWKTREHTDTVGAVVIMTSEYASDSRFVLQDFKDALKAKGYVVYNDQDLTALEFGRNETGYYTRECWSETHDWIDKDTLHVRVWKEDVCDTDDIIRLEVVRRRASEYCKGLTDELKRPDTNPNGYLVYSEKFPDTFLPFDSREEAETVKAAMERERPEYKVFIKEKYSEKQAPFTFTRIEALAQIRSGMWQAALSSEDYVLDARSGDIPRPLHLQTPYKYGIPASLLHPESRIWRKTDADALTTKNTHPIT